MRITDGGWHQSKSGNWYSPDVCRGMAAHVEAVCSVCNEGCLVRKHRGRDTGKPNFCSRGCKMRWQTATQDLSHLKRYEFKKGQQAHNFKGGHRHSAGYIMDYGDDRELYLQHRLVVEKFLGRKLRRSEVVHHINGDRTDNRIENLQLMNQSEHLKLHQMEEKMGDSEEYSQKKRHASQVRWRREKE